METGKKYYLLNDVVPLYALHPGGTLREVLRERKIKHKDFAHSNAIADKLEKGLGISATFWNNLQKLYELDLQRIKERDKLNYEGRGRR